jgi:hypothetical protein
MVHKELPGPEDALPYEWPSPIVEKTLEVLLPSDIALNHVIRSLEHLYRDIFHEEGEARSYFDLQNFPPHRLPRGKMEFKSILTTGDQLDTHQIQTLDPYQFYYDEPYFLLGELTGDADQLSPTLKDLTMINPDFQVLTIRTNPQNPEYFYYRLPEISLFAVRGESAALQFMINKDDFQIDADKQFDIDRVLSVAMEEFSNIQAGYLPSQRDFGEELRRGALT